MILVCMGKKVLFSYLLASDTICQKHLDKFWIDLYQLKLG